MFADVVRAHRRRLGLTQEELADHTGLSGRSIGNLEAGATRAPRPATVRLLADAFGLTGVDRDRFFEAAAGQDTARPPSVRVSPQLPAGGAVVPAQLPATVPGFVGREAALKALDEMLPCDDADDRWPAAPVVISAVAGTAGVGKTALAVHWAHRVADRFPDGQLHVDLRGFSPDGQIVTPAVALRRFLDALQVPAQRIPADPDAQAALYRSLLAGRRMLVLLDNARDAEQVRRLLPGAGRVLVLITSRNRLTSLVAIESAQSLNLDLLSTQEARELLARRLGADRVAAEPEAVDNIIEGCARLPLALAIAAAHAAQSGLPLAALAADLHDTGRHLDTLDAGDPASQVRAVLSWSYTTLARPAARLLRLLGLHPGPDISAAAAASLAGCPPAEVAPMLTELSRANLISEQALGRYTWHDLLRAYAAELATQDPEPEGRKALTRLLDHYLHTAHTAARLLAPSRVPITLTAPEPGTNPEHPADHQQALAWFTAEHAVLLSAIDHAGATGLDIHALQLAWTLTDFLDRRGHWHDLATTQLAAVTAAGQLNDPPAQVSAYRNLARAYIQLGRYEEASTELLHALDLATHTCDPAGQADTHYTLAILWERQGCHSEALDHARQALDVSRATGNLRGQAIGLNAVGWYHALLGNHRQALTACRQALPLLQELGNRLGQAATWDSLGYAHHHLGHQTQAITCYRHAIDLYRDIGDRHHEAETLSHLGDTHHAVGNPQAAQIAWQQALAILDELDHPDADQLRNKLAPLDPDRKQPDGEPGGPRAAPTLTSGAAVDGRRRPAAGSDRINHP